MLLTTSAADIDNFPIKSQNMDTALKPEFYVAPDVYAYHLYDAHPVHGCRTFDGGYVMVGKALERDGSTKRLAFAIKLSSIGSVLWVWRSDASAVANGVLQLPDAGGTGALIIAGYRVIGGKAQRTLTKLSSSNGSEEWNAAWAGHSGGGGGGGGKHGAWENIALTSDGTALLLAGLVEAASMSEFDFKSYGNVVSGAAVVTRLPVSAVLGNRAPAEAAVSWTYGPDRNYLTCKAARMLADGSVVALLFAEGRGKMAALVKVSGATGSVLWGPTDHGSSHGEGTDVVGALDGSGAVVITGHGDGGVRGALSGRLTKVNGDGSRAWSRSYSAGGTPGLIKNECWAVQPLVDGYVIGCGTGIEGCDEGGLSRAMKADCLAGRGDPRPGAHLRKPGVWQSLVVRTDLGGNLIWQRVDQHRTASKPPLGAVGWEAASSACEHVLASADGTEVAVISDEADGVGLLKLTTRGCVVTGDGTAAPAGCSSEAQRAPLQHPPFAAHADRGGVHMKGQAGKHEEEGEEEEEEGEEKEEEDRGGWPVMAAASLALGIGVGVSVLACTRRASGSGCLCCWPGASEATVPIVTATGDQA